MPEPAAKNAASAGVKPVAAPKSESMQSFETARTADTKEGKPEGAAKKPRRPAGERKDEQSTKVAGSKVNNKINERDLKDPKNKDCEIY